MTVRWLGVVVVAAGVTACGTPEQQAPQQQATAPPTTLREQDQRAQALEQSCKGGEQQACADLVQLQQQECDAQQMKNCNDLGRLLFEGTTVPADRDKALTLFEQACKGGYDKACSNLSALARLYAHEGPGQDLAKATQMLQTACDGGVAEACETLESMASPPADSPPAEK